MAGRKLTSDQKRAKKKQAERKRSLQRQHERNRVANRLDGFMRSITLAIEGFISVEELEQDVMALASTSAPAGDGRGARFNSHPWAALRRDTCHLVELMQFDPLGEEKWRALEGRLYTFGNEEDSPDDDDWYSTHSMPLAAVRLSCWDPVEVFVNFAQELHDAPTEGCYFFGWPIGQIALHFAIASTKDPHDRPQVYLVTASAWHPLGLEEWIDAIYPMMESSSLARDLAGKVDNTTTAVMMLAGLLKSAGTQAESLQLDRNARSLICMLGQGLVLEADDLAYTSRELAEVEDMSAIFERTPLSEVQDEVRTVQDDVSRPREQLTTETKQVKSLPALSSDQIPGRDDPARPLRARMTELIFGMARHQR